jgi:hypothetical protein
VHTLGTIRKFKTKNFTVIADALEDNCPDFSFDDTDETRRQVEDGTLTCFTARVRVLLHGREIGTDYLGNCIYRSIAEFMDHRACGKQNRDWAEQGQNARCGSYFSDMIHAAIAEARTYLAECRAIPVRTGKKGHRAGL